MENGVKKFARDIKTISRRKSVIDRLEKQLKNNTKTEKKTLKVVPLTDSDVNRIKRELETLKLRLG